LQGALNMNELWIFIWGLSAFFLAVGPLMVAAYLDYREKDQE
jgi:hypothetical protein